MGEAARTRRAHSRILQKASRCVYCGGAADTVEHMPPRIMFRGKQRPKGLEFPSCRPCNNGTSTSDLVASLIGRMSPDPETQTDRDDVDKLLRSVHANVPGLLEEMRMGRGGQKLALRGLSVDPDSGALKANGPLLTKHMNIFGAKIGFALHAEAFGEPVPLDGAVMPIWYSNHQALRGELPQELLSVLPEGKTLSQGRKEVSDQFQYTWAITEERSNGLFFVTFREAFAVAAITGLNRAFFRHEKFPKWQIFAPGDFRPSRLEP